MSVRAPVVVALVGGLLTTGATALAVHDAVDDAQARFDALAEQTRLTVQERLGSVTDVAAAIRDGLMAAPGFDHAHFHQVAMLSRSGGLLDTVQAISVVRPVAVSETAAYVAEQRARTAGMTGYDGFDVVPATVEADDRFVVEMIEPVAGNEGAIGFDVGSNASRRAALEAARDRGQPAATEPITLVQEDGDGRAVLLLLPIYTTQDVPVTAPARRRHLTAVLSVAIRVDDLMDDVLRPDAPVDLIIHDVGETAGRTQDRTGDEWRLYASGALAAGDAANGMVATELDLDVGGRRWRMLAVANDRFAGAVWTLPWLVVVIGLTGTGLLVRVVSATALGRRRAESLVNARTAELRLMIDHAPDATLVVDANGIIRNASRQVERVLRHDPATLVGRSIEELIPTELRGVHERYRDGFTRSARSPSAMATEREVVALRGDGTTVDVEVSLNPLPAPPDDPEAVTVIASVRDVTERREAARRAVELNEQKLVFLRTVSHELRTPLTAVDGFVDVLDRFGDDLDPTTRADYLRRVRRNTASLQRLIGEIIDFAALDREGHGVHVGPLDLTALAHEVVRQLEPVTSTHEVVVLGTSPVVALADVDATTRVLTNLLTNAVRYSPDGSTVTVTVTDDDGPTVLVDDQGPGVPEHERAQVFERFWRGSGDHVVREPGTGIGLAVVAELTAAQGGSVHVTSSPDGGARFVVHLARVAPVGGVAGAGTHAGPAGDRAADEPPVAGGEAP